MSIRGEKFFVDLSDETEETAQLSTVAAGSGMDFVGDIVERASVTARPPTLPAMKNGSTGFPEHKIRTKVSAFKQSRTPAPVIKTTNGSSLSSEASRSAKTTKSQAMNDTQFNEDTERRRIDEENRKRLHDMSETEIKEEREELLSSLSPAMVEMLLKRANLDEARAETDFEADSDVGGEKIPMEKQDHKEQIQPESNTGSIAIPLPVPKARRVTAPRSVRFEEDEPVSPAPLQPLSSITKEDIQRATPSIHFPIATPAPDLDPSDPSFLENLHSKYFPSLPSDPTKLAWMAPIPTHGSVADRDSPYYPNQAGLAASSLRFDFRGGLLPPRIARAVPVSKGLHHHGEAPEAAGYTVPELARLARSAYPAQRCMAYQTLGRLLYRLGRGEWGQGGEVSMGLWRCVKEGQVLETLEEAAHAEGGHQGSKAYATEALWLWQKGGGERWKAD